MTKALVATGVISVIISFFAHKEYDKYQHKKELEVARQQEIQRQINYRKAQEAWADSILRTMTTEEKIGQLFMVASWSNKDEQHFKEIDKLVAEQRIGGVIFFQGSPSKQALLTNRYQAKAKVPLMIAIDGEWGLGMRLDSTISFPRAMILGAIQDNQLIEEMGEEIARQCRRLGIHANLSPVADVNSNAANPVIGTRSFGENKENVAQKAIAYMRGLQRNGIIATAKHFPGHGDTDADSHYTLPIIKHSQERLHKVELYPFKRMIEDSLLSVMVAHVHVPSLDSTKNLPTTLSPYAVQKLLIDSLNFKGLIFTDALNMQGVAKFYKAGEVEVKALQAGNDILLYPADVPKGIAAIKEAIANQTLSLTTIEKRVKKLLMSKYFVGLNKYKPVVLKNLNQDLSTAKAKALREKLYQQAVTVVRNEDNLIPFVTLENNRFASVSIGTTDKYNDFQRILSKYTKFEHFQIAKGANSSEFDKIVSKLKDKDIVIIGLHNIDAHKPQADFGITENSKKFIAEVEKLGKKVVVVVFGNAYSLKYFDNSKYLVCAYEDDNTMRKAVPQVLFGAIANHALLPVSASEKAKLGSGQPIRSLKRLQYSDYPESVGMTGAILNKIDTIAQWAIDKGATPGCQILVAKDGKVIFEKAYGHLTYDKKEPVTEETFYDLASLTKVTATMQALMKLWEEGKIDINEKVSTYLPELKGTNKENIRIIDVLTHTSGLALGDPLWTKVTFKNWKDESLVASTKQDLFPIELNNGLYAHVNMEQQIWDWIVAHDLRANKKNADGTYRYLYTDVGFYMFKRMIERVTGECLDYHVEKNYYAPLGIQMTYLPLEKYQNNEVAIAPTEIDNYFRKKEVRGTVHDPDAALMGGVAGHAGVFGTANDVAVLMQMNLQKGEYGGRRYFQKDSTIEFFAFDRQNNRSRRGLGWDKPQRSAGGHCSKFCSQQTFGHTGFTGTAVWTDPAYNLTYVFLSNRSYPNANNRKLNHLAVRTIIHDVIYEAMGFKTQYVYLEKGASASKAKGKKKRGRR